MCLQLLCLRLAFTASPATVNCVSQAPARPCPPSSWRRGRPTTMPSAAPPTGGRWRRCWRSAAATLMRRTSSPCCTGWVRARQACWCMMLSQRWGGGRFWAHWGLLGRGWLLTNTGGGCSLRLLWVAVCFSTGFDACVCGIAVQWYAVCWHGLKGALGRAERRQAWGVLPWGTAWRVQKRKVPKPGCRNRNSSASLTQCINLMPGSLYKAVKHRAWPMPWWQPGPLGSCAGPCTLLRCDTSLR